jgi:3',5'-nucleoside bisphosphate phosphatase
MTEFRADLHVHSSCSDGTDSPLALLGLAKQVGLSGLSITDHDTLGAYTPEIWDKAAKLSLALLIGVEISSEWKEEPIHILAYGFHHSLEDFLGEVRKRRVERNRKILHHLKKQGIKIAEEELAAPVIGRPHIAKILMDRKIISSIQEGFDRFLQEDLIRYTIGNKFSSREVVEAIHHASGRAVLAHPHLIKRRSIVKELLTLPFDGLECYYGRRPIQLEREWLEIAKKHNLIATGGSDYHGSIRSTPIGCSWVREGVFRALQS